jgi:predicted component of type VI protein secretion system
LNIFDILFSSNRSLTEEHVTGFLSWLLDPTQTHGAGTVFLERVLKANVLKTHPAPNFFSDWLNPHTVAYREVKTAVETMTEREVVTTLGKKRSIDIVLYFWRIDSNGDRKREYVVAVENKIRNESITDDNQLSDELEGLRVLYERVPISMLLLTPSKTDKSPNCFLKLPKDDVNRHFHLGWKGKESIAEILQNVLRDEAVGEISPISAEVKLCLRSFISYALHDFTSRKTQPSFGAIGRNYDDTVTGFDNLRALIVADPDLMVGYLGGLNELRRDVEENLDHLLNNRIYKIVKELDANKHTRKNWIPIKEFCDIINVATTHQPEQVME